MGSCDPPTMNAKLASRSRLGYTGSDIGGAVSSRTLEPRVGGTRKENGRREVLKYTVSFLELENASP